MKVPAPTTKQHISSLEFTPNASKEHERRPAADGSAVAAPSNGNVRVTLSAEARRLAQGAEDAVDEQKVERLRNMMRDGTYRFDSALIAAKILAEGEEA